MFKNKKSLLAATLMIIITTHISVNASESLEPSLLESSLEAPIPKHASEVEMDKLIEITEKYPDFTIHTQTSELVNIWFQNINFIKLNIQDREESESIKIIEALDKIQANVNELITENKISLADLFTPYQDISYALSCDFKTIRKKYEKYTYKPYEKYLYLFFVSKDGQASIKAFSESYALKINEKYYSIVIIGLGTNQELDIDGKKGNCNSFFKHDYHGHSPLWNFRYTCYSYFDQGNEKSFQENHFEKMFIFKEIIKSIYYIPEVQFFLFYHFHEVGIEDTGIFFNQLIVKILYPEQIILSEEQESHKNTKSHTTLSLNPLDINLAEYLQTENGGTLFSNDEDQRIIDYLAFYERAKELIKGFVSETFYQA